MNLEAAKRAWSAPLWTHALALGILLVLGLVLTRPFFPVTADEGVSLLQARHLNETGRWLVDPPPSSIDPDGWVTVPYYAERGTLGKAFYPKHPVYPWVLSKIDAVSGTSGMVGLSTLGAWTTALFGALLARELGTKRERTTLWLVGVGSPVFFYAYLVVAHTVASTLACLGTLALLRAVRVESKSRFFACGVAVIACCGLATAVRSEAVFLGPGFALALVVTMAKKRRFILRYAVLSLFAVVATAGAAIGDKIALHRLIGTLLPAPLVAEPNSFFSDRFLGFFTTWFGVSNSPEITRVLVLLAFSAVALTAYALMKQESRVAVGLLGLAAAMYISVAIFASPSAISGIALVFPVGWLALLVSLRYRSNKSDSRQCVAIICAASAIGVLLTEYSTGGGLEWGGRYFLFLIPLATPLLLVALNSAIEAVPSARQVLISLMVIATATTSLLAVQGIRAPHQAVARLSDATSQSIDELQAKGEHPYIVSTMLLVPQLTWELVDTKRWLVPDAEHVDITAQRLAATRQNVVLLLTRDASADLGHFAHSYSVTSERKVPAAGMSVVTLRLKP